VAALAIEPGTIYLLPAENVRLSARVTRADGSTLGLVKASWRSLKPEIVGVVDSNGLVVGLSPGEGVLAASVGAVTATAPVVVALTEYAFEATRVVLAPERTETLHVVVPGQQNRELRSTDLAWRSSDTSVARVSPAGIVAAVAPGKAEISVSGFLQERRIPVVVHRKITTFYLTPDPATVVQVPLLATRAFTVRAQAADSTPVPEVVYDWSVRDTAVASFDPATLTLRARAPGTTALSFVVKGFKPVSWNIRVVSGQLGLTPARFSLSPGASRRIIATVFDSSGKSLGPATEVRWSTSNAAVATAAEDGTVRAVGLGSANVTATVPGGRTASAQVFVVGDVLVSATRGTGRLGLYHFLTASPGEWQTLLVDGAGNQQGVFSPDRSRIAFSSERAEPGNLDLFVADADGQNLHRVTSEPGSDHDVAWLPDSDHLVFASLRSKTSQLYVVGADGSGLRRLTDSPGGNREPTVSADAARIAFTSSRDGNDEIYLTDLAGGPQVNLTQTSDRDESLPHFLPDGDLLFLVHGRGAESRYQIVRRIESTTSLLPVAASPEPITALSVSRDGRWLAYIVVRVTDQRSGATESSCYLQALSGGPPVPVPLLPGERIASVAF
jgi:Tol biopolymer transport system component